MKKLLPLIALVASCATQTAQTRVDHIDQSAQEECARMSEEELVKDAYKNVILSNQLLAADLAKGCFDYGLGFKFGDGGRYALAARKSDPSATVCFENSNSPFSRVVTAGLVIADKVEGHPDILRLYVDVNENPMGKRTYIDMTILDCWDTCRDYDEGFVKILKQVCAINKTMNKK